jgi:hypothetical protein
MTVDKTFVKLDDKKSRTEHQRLQATATKATSQRTVQKNSMSMMDIETRDNEGAVQCMSCTAGKRYGWKSGVRRRGVEW